MTVQTVFVLSGGGVSRYRQCFCNLVVVVCDGTDSVCVIWWWWCVTVQTVFVLSGGGGGV